MVVAGAPESTSDQPDVPIDVCLEDELLWFDNGELEELPGPAPAVAPGPEQDARFQQIMTAFDQGLDQAMAERDHADLMDRMADRVTSHNRLVSRLVSDPR